MPAMPPKLTVVAQGQGDSPTTWDEFMASVREIIAVNAECGGDLSKLQFHTWSASDRQALDEAQAFLEEVEGEMLRELKARADRPN
jgi:hypothetical protein